MIQPAILGLFAALTLLLTGTMAGSFYAYSISVMLGLDAIDARPAIAAMQAINVKVRNPVFFVTFFATPVVAVATALLFLAAGRRIAAALFLAAGIAYLGGALLPTALVNVPMNEALATGLVPADPGAAARLWSEYSARWTWWNTLRTLFSALALLLAGAAIFVKNNGFPPQSSGEVPPSSGAEGSEGLGPGIARGVS